MGAVWYHGRKEERDMRITKEPEERRQEIFDAALKLFGEKGYEKITITDIAKSIGVSQGLCYRYFPSKEVLFDSAIEQYADILVSQFAEMAENTHMPLKQFIEEMPLNVEDQNTKYYAVCEYLDSFTDKIETEEVYAYLLSKEKC